MLASSNAGNIDIIDPLRQIILYSLWGHKNIIKSIYWTDRNEYLISTCASGGIFFWRGNFRDAGYSTTDEIQPEHQYYDNTVIQKVFYDSDMKALIALTNNSNVYGLLISIGSYGEQHFYHENFQNADFKLTCIAFSK
jgi:WD40 repeat protein